MNADVITALTCLNEATERLQLADVAIAEAYTERRAALTALDTIQEQFDSMYKHLIANAPTGTRWWQTTINKAEAGDPGPS